ncbi:MAG: hypothetical protein OEN50_11225 [Deltaproteobacteria bacterium]|nr:hypothetical protein [Deltaproteobacteria bacterium]
MRPGSAIYASTRIPLAAYHTVVACGYEDWMSLGLKAPDGSLKARSAKEELFPRVSLRQ